jgi:peptidoglycan-associated lipoprotein
MRRASSLLGVVGAAVFLVACPPTYPKCSNDEHCKEHSEVCVQGQCQECATDQNCKAGFQCQGNKCVPKPECTPEQGCGDGKDCLGGKCVPWECRADTECGNKGKCVDHKCQAPPPGSCNTNDDCATGEECKSGSCVARPECPMEPVRFGFNQYSLDKEAQQKLAPLAECAKAQGLKLTLEGHADERGTEEYNLHLSNRRAAAVKRYLSDLGVSAAKLETVGYGENRPADSGHTEDAWAANRRVEFKK